MQVSYLKQAVSDLKKFDKALQIRILKAITKVPVNPYPQTAGGYGKPLGNHQNRDLSGFLKIRVGDVRVVYTIKTVEQVMLIIVIAIRDDFEVYDMAAVRKVQE